jgi:hypothetical protein
MRPDRYPLFPIDAENESSFNLTKRQYNIFRYCKDLSMGGALLFAYLEALSYHPFTQNRIYFASL